MKLLLNTTFALLFASALPLLGQIAYQGRITDSTGAPISGPGKALSFSLFSAASGGTQVWGPQNITTDTVDGRFAVTLGPTDATNRQINQALLTGSYLQISVGGVPLAPRQQILSTPRSLTAEIAQGIGVRGTTPYITTNGNNIGVNTTSASFPFDVSGDTRITGNTRILGSESSGAVGAFTVSNGSNNLIFDGDEIDSSGLLSINFNTNQAIRFGTGAITCPGPLTASGSLTATKGLSLSGLVVSPPSYPIPPIAPTFVVNGDTVMNSPSTALSIITPSSAESFRRPLAVWYANGALGMCYQADQNFGTAGTGLIVGLGSAWKPGGGSWSSTSDRRLKKNVETLHGSLDRLGQLRPVSFEFKNEARHGVCGTQIGFIAQEVEEVFPNWVLSRSNDKSKAPGESPEPETIKTISITGFEALTVDAMRELRAEKDSQIDALKEENKSLAARLDALEAKLGAIATSLQPTARPDTAMSSK